MFAQGLPGSWDDARVFPHLDQLPAQIAREAAVSLEPNEFRLSGYQECLCNIPHRSLGEAAEACNQICVTLPLIKLDQARSRRRPRQVRPRRTRPIICPTLASCFIIA